MIIFPVFGLKVSCATCGYVVVSAERVSPQGMSGMLALAVEEMQAHSAEKHHTGPKIEGAWSVEFTSFFPEPPSIRTR